MAASCSEWFRWWKITSTLCELGPRSTGKSHVYKEISPNSILVSGGQTTVANLFYNMASQNRLVWLAMWDVRGL